MLMMSTLFWEGFEKSKNDVRGRVGGRRRGLFKNLHLHDMYKEIKREEGISACCDIFIFPNLPSLITDVSQSGQ